MQSTSIIARAPASWLTLSLLAGVGSHLPVSTMLTLGSTCSSGRHCLSCAGSGSALISSPLDSNGCCLASRSASRLDSTWRTSPFLRLADAIGLVTCAVLMPLVREESLLTLRLHRFLGGVRNLVARVGTGLIPAAFDAQEAARGRGAPSVLLPAARGMVLAVPAVVVFGSLLASADADFERLVNSLVRLDPEWLVTTSLSIMFFSWLAAGVLSRRTGANVSLPWGPGGLGAIEVSIVLGVVDVMFLTFVVLQGRYFFGGEALVRQDPGLSFSEYARRGFFELVTVSALVLPLALVIKGRLRHDDSRAMRSYRIAAGVLTALTLVIVASAFHRMAIYQRQFGLTEQRFYASAFIGGIAYTLVWFASTVLAGRDRRFLGGTLVAWTAWVAMLHLTNPAAVIARVNIQRATEGRAFRRGIHRLPRGRRSPHTNGGPRPAIAESSSCSSGQAQLGTDRPQRARLALLVACRGEGSHACQSGSAFRNEPLRHDPSMSNSIIILQVLGFLGTGGLIVAGLAGTMWTASRGWATLSRNLAFGTFGLVALYITLLVGGGMLSRGRILPLNAEKYFCELDCHLAYSVTDVRESDSLGTAEDGLRPNGRFWLVTVRTWFDPNTISARRSLTEPTWPAPRKVALVSAEGVRYAPVEDVDAALSRSRNRFYSHYEGASSRRLIHHNFRVRSPRRDCAYRIIVDR